MKLRDTTSHLLLFMIADEKQYSKPHSILNFVRAFSFCSISDDSVSKVCNELRASMISIGLVPVGFVTDGEWNSIRTMWTDRPISVMQLLMDAQKEGTLMHVPEITKCLTIKYACLKSIMAQYIYRYKIDSWALQDVDFINHPYFPEYDERVGEYFHEREDRGHVLKRFTHSFRDGNIPGTDLRTKARTNGKCDFRLVDVSRRIKPNRVHGVTRETVIALLANLTSLQMRRHEYRDRGMTSELPRSGTSDDVESFISVLYEMFGDVFDMKSFFDSYPKVLNEFCKRIDPAYYWTGTKTRFTEPALPSLNQPSSNGVERFDCVKV